jgi:hypothetical protein
MADLQPLTRSDFTGGFTDDLFDQDPTVCFYNDNLLMDDDDKPVTRWGSQYLAQPGAASRVGTIMVVDHETGGSPTKYAYVQVARSLYYGSISDSTGQVSSLSTFGSDFLSQNVGTTPVNLTWGTWDGVLYYAGYGKRPFKWVPGLGSAGAITAGLPDVPNDLNTDVYANEAAMVTAAATLAVAIRSAMNTHFADTGQHTAADTVASALLPSATPPASTSALITYVNSLIDAYVSHFTDQRTISQYHKKETESTTIPQVTLAQQTLESVEAPTDIYECVDRLHDLKTSYNSHFANQDIHTNTSGSSATVTSAFLLGVDKGPRISQNLQAVYDFANRLKTKYGTHIASGGSAGTAHSTGADGTNTITAANATDYDTLATLIYNLRASYNAHDIDSELAAGWAFHVAQNSTDHSLDRRAPTSSPPNADTWWGLYGGPKTLSDMVDALNELKLKYNGHVEDWTTHYTTNPGTAEANTLPGPDLALGNYVYAFCWKHSFSQNSLKTVTDTGPTLLKSVEAIAVEYAPLTISRLPTFANTSGVSHWITDTTLVLQIYRTSSGGTDFFLVGEVTNGTSTFTDDVTDEELVTREALYTNGGEADNDPPPACNAFHAVNGYGYYGNTYEVSYAGALSDYQPTRLYQSKKDDIDSVPGDFYEDLKSAIIGVSSVRSVPVVFCKRQIVRIEGAIDDLGRGGMNPVDIASTMGCVSQASIVQIEGGIIFAGTDGFAFTDGYQIVPLSDKWKNTYQSLIDTETKKLRITGTYDPDNKLVFYSVQRNSASSDNDAWLVLDLSYGLQKPCWLSASNGSIFSPTALAITASGKLMRGDRQGYVFQHKESYTTDPYVNTAISPGSWGTAPIAPDYQSCQIDFGDRSAKKWVPGMSIVCKQLTGLNLAIQSNSDDGKHVGALEPIDRDAVAYTAPTDVAFGTPSNPLSYDGVFEEKRHFPAGSLRCNTKAIRFTASVVTLRDSVTDSDGTATVASTAVTLDNGAKSWPSDCVGQYLTLAGDSYVTRYRIIRRNSATVITLASAPSNGSTAWRIVGQVKDQRWKLLSYTLRFRMHDYAQSSTGDET